MFSVSTSTIRALAPAWLSPRGAASFLVFFYAAIAASTGYAAAQNAPQPIPIPAQSEQAQQSIQILYVKEDREREEPPLSLLDQPSPDDGIAGAKLGIADNNTTGRFLNQSFKLDVLNGNVDDLIKGAQEKLAAGDAFIIADMAPDSLLKFSDAMAGKPVQIFNVGNPDDRLREEDCRANVMHTAPTRSMLADALAQYLVWKRWPNWLMVVGPSQNDQMLADAYRRAAKKFGAKIVEERQFKVDTGNRRADGGFEQIQQQIPQFMQGAKDHDVVLVVDEDEVFGDYFPYRTWVPRPIVGSTGLIPTSWHASLELWGGTQFQNRFKRLANRPMRAIDYDAWLAVRAVGEAASRTHQVDFKTLRDYMHSPKFEVAGFKGVALSFRGWNGQVREPLIVTNPKMFVSVSPQQGFLHQFSVLDTLGIDKPETKCKAYTQ
ncbi:ABC transporter substrate-binding protein [Hyphomicrobium sp.]|uniref:ABC transporter substrate-binding protein n=1 Tax=Hyphomicrobium sp. TaxID=82 RepID=UPI0025B9C4C1|nr:ABC transporter substrate-binding protein [Hyphomicrobium sp.]